MQGFPWNAVSSELFVKPILWLCVCCFEKSFSLFSLWTAVCKLNAAVARCCLFTADKFSQWEHLISSMLEVIKYSLEQWFELTYLCSLLNTGLHSELLSGGSNGSLIVYENMNSFNGSDFHVQLPYNSIVSCSQLSTLTIRLLSIIQAATTGSFFLLECMCALRRETTKESDRYMVTETRTNWKLLKKSCLMPWGDLTLRHLWVLKLLFSCISHGFPSFHLYDKVQKSWPEW